MPSQLIKIAKTPALECSPPKSIYEASLSPSLLTLVVTSGVLTGCGHSGLPILFRGGPHLASNLVFLENYKISQETIAAYWRQTIIWKTHEPWCAPLLLGLHERCSTHSSAASYSKIGLAWLHILKETPNHQCICLLVKGSQHLSLVQKKGLTRAIPL